MIFKNAIKVQLLYFTPLRRQPSTSRPVFGMWRRQYPLLYSGVSKGEGARTPGENRGPPVASLMKLVAR